jgi:preprotein translocase subunit SecF
LKDLGLVLFVGMSAAVYSSIFFATPVLVTLKQRQPKVQAHTRRVLTRRNSAATKRRAEQAALDADTALDVASASDPEPVVTTANASVHGTGKRQPAKRPTAKPAPTARRGQMPAKGGRRRH